MELNFEHEAANASGQAPMVAQAGWSNDSLEAAQASVTAVWQTESDRFLKQAYRLLHRFPGCDVESLVGDTLLWALENAQSFTGAEHCRKAMSIKVRHLALHVIRDTKMTVEADASLADPSGKPVTTTGEDATLAWLFGLCADDTERRILTIWMLPGNQTAQSTSAETAKWKAPWTTLEVNQLMRRLRAKMGVQIAAASKLRFTTKGTMPGLHCQGFRTLGSVLLRTTGGRKVTYEERLAERHVVPALVWDAIRGWVAGRAEVYSTTR